MAAHRALRGGAALLLACAAALLLLLLGAPGGRGGPEAELLSEGLYIVPQANVLTGAGQRPMQPAGKQPPAPAAPSGLPEHKGVRASALAKRTAVHMPVHHKWTAQQKAVQASVEKVLEAARRRRERSFSLAARKQYAAIRAAALKHERHRQARFSATKKSFWLRGEEQVDAINSKDYFEQDKLRGRRQSVLYDMAREKDAEDSGARKMTHSKDLAWQH